MLVSEVWIGPEIMPGEIPRLLRACHPGERIRVVDADAVVLGEVGLHEIQDGSLPLDHVHALHGIAGKDSAQYAPEAKARDQDAAAGLECGPEMGAELVLAIVHDTISEFTMQGRCG